MSLYAKLAAALALAVFIFGVHWHGVSQGKKLERAEWQEKDIARKDAEAQAVAKANQENWEAQRKIDRGNVEVSTNHEKAIQTLSANLSAARAAIVNSGGLRVPGTICNQFAAATQAAGNGGHNGDSTGTVELPQAITDDLFALAARADEVVEQARACQGWINKNGFYR